MNFLTGFGIGLALGILYAPKSGEELRSDIRERANEVADNARQSIEDAKERVRQGAEGFKSARQRPTGTER